MGPVENEDYVSSLLRLTSGARVVLEASRILVGEKNNYGFEVNGPWVRAWVSTHPRPGSCGVALSRRQRRAHEPYTPAGASCTNGSRSW